MRKKIAAIATTQHARMIARLRAFSVVVREVGVFTIVFILLLAGQASVLAARTFLPSIGVEIRPRETASIVPARVPTGTLTLTTGDGRTFVVSMKDRPTWWTAASRYALASSEIVITRSATLPAAETVVTIDTRAIRTFVTRELASQIDSATRDTHIAVVGDRATFDGIAIDGRTVDVDTLVTRITTALRRGDARVVIPTSVTRAVITPSDTATARGIVSLLGETRMDYTGSPADRAHNVAAAAEKLNGLIIPTGATWSYNDAVFPLSARDFREAHVIVGGKLVDELGGGVCQTSSAMFRAALDAGLPIVEQHPHSLKLPFYDPPGLDAAVYPGQKDFKFKNDTGHDIAINAVTEGQTIRVQLYGTRDERRVNVTGPFTIDGDEKITLDEKNFLWRREITRSGEPAKTETYRARYRG